MTGFLVWNPNRALPTVRHDTYASAKAEAERLRAAHPAETFLVMAPVRSPKAVAAAEALSDGLEQGRASMRSAVARAARNVDDAWSQSHKLQRRLSAFEQIAADPAGHQATIADCLCWFDGFNAAHAGKETWDRPTTPGREQMRRLNAALQALLPAATDDEEVPF